MEIDNLSNKEKCVLARITNDVKILEELYRNNDDNLVRICVIENQNCSKKKLLLYALNDDCFYIRKIVLEKLQKR